MKVKISATIEEQIYKEILKELEKKDEFGRNQYRNQSQLIEGILFVGLKQLKKKSN